MTPWKREKTRRQVVEKEAKGKRANSDPTFDLHQFVKTDDGRSQSGHAENDSVHVVT